MKICGRKRVAGFGCCSYSSGWLLVTPKCSLCCAVAPVVKQLRFLARCMPKFAHSSSSFFTSLLFTEMRPLFSETVFSEPAVTKFSTRSSSPSTSKMAEPLRPFRSPGATVSLAPRKDILIRPPGALRGADSPGLGGKVAFNTDWSACLRNDSSMSRSGLGRRG